MDTVIVYDTLSPILPEAGEIPIDRSALTGTMVTDALAELSDGLESVTPGGTVALAVLVIVPPAPVEVTAVSV